MVHNVSLALAQALVVHGDGAHSLVNDVSESKMPSGRVASRLRSRTLQYHDVVCHACVTRCEPLEGSETERDRERWHVQER